jgi:hypothetical protein
MKLKIVLAAALSAPFAAMAGGCGSNGDDSSNNSTTGAKTTPAAGSSKLPQGSESVKLDPADFTTEINNPYWPITPGSKWVYRGQEGGGNQRIEVTVTNETKKIDGIESRVVKDEVTEGGNSVEITRDWYAQDSAGNVWYMGEDTKEYKKGKVSSTKGSWEHGVNGAYAGVIMPAKPRVGLAYRQEYYKGEAEDRARVLSLDAQAIVPFGRFAHALETEDTTPLEPKVVEHKYYARNVGPVLKDTPSGGGREALIDYRPAP